MYIYNNIKYIIYMCRLGRGMGRALGCGLGRRLACGLGMWGLRGGLGGGLGRGLAVGCGLECIPPLVFNIFDNYNIYINIYNIVIIYFLYR